MKCPKCGWQNPAGTEKCIQCDAVIEKPDDIAPLPHRGSKKTQFKGTQRSRFRRTARPSIDSGIPGLLKRTSNRVIRYITTQFPTYVRIVGITVAGYVPGLIHFRQ